MPSRRVVLALGLAILAVCPFILNPYLVFVMSVVFIYTILTLELYLLPGIVIVDSVKPISRRPRDSADNLWLGRPVPRLLRRLLGTARTDQPSSGKVGRRGHEH